MDDKKKKTILSGLFLIAVSILLLIGGTFAYFTATISSDEGAIGAGAAEFQLSLEEDTSLIKSQLIPSIEQYVDMATTERVDENGFIKPYLDDKGNTVTEGTACIDDYNNEICSIYTFTVVNDSVTSELPLSITLSPSINSFENLYFKVLDSNQQVVTIAGTNEPMTAIHLVNDSEDTEDGTITPTRAGNLDMKIAGAVKNGESGENEPARATYSIVLFIKENHSDQTVSDSGKMFAASLMVEIGGVGGGGITGVISAAGTENTE